MDSAEMKQTRVAVVGMTYRFAPLERSAELMVVDLETEQVLKSIWLSPPIFDLTSSDRPTGGGRQRGARGVVVRDDRIFVATFDTIHCLDFSLQYLGSVSNERFCDIHEFQVTNHGFVVSSTRMDSVVWCDRSGIVERIWCATEDPDLIRSDLGVPFIPRERGADWRSLYPQDNPTHLNAISFLGSDVLVALHNQGVLWNIDAGAVHHDARGLNAIKTHNHQRLECGTIVFNDTHKGRFFQCNENGQVCIDVSEPGISANRPVALSATWAVAHGWLRGFASLDPHRVIVGQCPASLIILNTETQALEKIVRLSDDWRVSVNGLALS